MGNNPVGKKVNTPKVNTWVNTLLRKYPGCLKVNTFLLLALGFYVNPTQNVALSTAGVLSSVKCILRRRCESKTFHKYVGA